MHVPLHSERVLQPWLGRRSFQIVPWLGRSFQWSVRVCAHVCIIASDWGGSVDIQVRARSLDRVAQA